MKSQSGETVFPSAIGMGLSTFLITVLGGSSLVMFWQEAWAGLVINVLAATFIGYVLWTTRYILYDNQLIIKSGFLFHQTIPVSSIKSIAESGDITSAPAASGDRLAIFHGKFGRVLVSPRNKKAFVEALLEINPEIEMKWSVKKQ